MDPIAIEASYDQAFSRLCHFAALSRSNKIEAATDGIVLAAWALRESDSVEDALEVLFGLHLPPEIVQDALGRLEESHRLERNGSMDLVLSASARAQYEARVRGSEELQAQVREQWLEVTHDLRAMGVEDDRLWNCLESYVCSSFRRHGARALELLGARSRDPEIALPLEVLLHQAIEQNKLQPQEERIKTAIRRFFEDPPQSRVKYFSQLLDATFTFFALTLDHETARLLAHNLRPLKVFFDTNLLFAILGLGDAHQVETARLFVEQVNANQLPFTLYYHEETTSELHGVLENARRALVAIDCTPAMSRQIVEDPEKAFALSSIELTYHRRNAQTPTQPEVFLSQYQSPDRILKEKGLRLYRASAPSARENEEAEELARKLIEYVRGHPGKDGRRRDKKPAAAIHDIHLWRAVRSQRGPGQTALEIGAILLTNDYGLQRFGWDVLEKDESVGSIVLTTQLLQVLRPFTPATADFDRQYVQNLTLPEFRVANSNYQEAVRYLLAYLTTYKDLDEDIRLKVLGDEVLNLKLKRVTTPEERTKAIDASIVERLREMEQRVRDLEAQLEARRDEPGSLQPASREAGAIQQPPAPQPAPRPKYDPVVEEYRRFRILALAALLAAIIWAGPVIFAHLSPFAELAKNPHEAGIQLVLTGLVSSVLIPVWMPRRHLALGIGIGAAVLAASIGVSALL